jgi:hypothetical protein
VQDHLSWVAASVGMNGSYAYNATVPGGADPLANVSLPSPTFASTGTWNVDYRIGNDQTSVGLDFLIAPPPPDPQQSCQQSNAPPTPYINRSQSNVGDVINWPGRAFGTFVTAASGNFSTSIVACARLKNGMCVGAFDYSTSDDPSTHHRTDLGPNLGNVGSSFLNDTAFDPTLERPHLLGPGNHEAALSGLHMPSIDVDPPSTQMRHADYAFPSGGILGTSFSAPTALSAAIQAHQFEGWFSNLAYPMVNKAVLLASTRDANNDGPIGKFSTWSQNANPSNGNVDAEDGAGQIKFDKVSAILTNNQYARVDLADSNFVSCGTNCRKYTVTSLVVAPSTSTRVALAWQSCMIAEGSVPQLNNDLDLALNCGSPLIQCGGTTISSTATSELEMLERPSCTFQRTCSIEIRIKNGAPLLACGSTNTERVGVAWSFNN